MNVLVDIGHPGHVHLYKNLCKQLEKDGHKVYYSVRDVPVALHLMEVYQMPYLFLGKKSNSILGKAWKTIKNDVVLFWFVVKHKIDIGISSGISLSHVSKITRMKSFIFGDDDDDVAQLAVKYGFPYAEAVLSPSALEPTHRKTPKAVFYAGYHELAYLHPNVFTPDESVLTKIGLKKDDRYFILRFVALNAYHDIGQQGISFEKKKQLIDLLNEYGRVIITSEKSIEPEFEKYKLTIPAEDMHSLMYYSSLYIGDSQTMASEAAVLGVPSLRCNTFVGRIAYLEEEEHQYGLTYGFSPDCFDQLLAKAKELLQDSDTKRIWEEKRQKMLSEKIDVSAFFTWFIENYPQSREIMKTDPDYQYRFK